MPQYFFNLTNGETVRDEQGTRCDTVEDVKTYALAVAAELGRNRSPEELNMLALCVIDDRPGGVQDEGGEHANRAQCRGDDKSGAERRELSRINSSAPGRLLAGPRFGVLNVHHGLHPFARQAEQLLAQRRSVRLLRQPHAVPRKLLKLLC